MPDVSVAVVVCSYDPDEGLMHLVDSLRKAGVAPIVIDDGSHKPVDPGSGSILVRLPSNRGLAAALNQGLAMARSLNATHVVTFDQDSLVDSEYIEHLAAYWARATDRGLPLAALGAGNIPSITYRGNQVGELTVVPEVVQSGTMFDLAALQEAGDFDESLVIDSVDTDACLRLRRHGLVVAVAPLEMEHKLGDARTFHVLGRQVLLTRHEPFRHYYMTRNRLIMIRRNLSSEPAWSLGMLRRTIVAGFLTVLLDDNRRMKARAILAGVRDGLRDRRGPVPPRRRSL